MKKFLLPLLALALTATAASAQDVQPEMSARQGGQGPRRSPEEMAANQTKRLTQELSLTPDQATKVQQIMLNRQNEMQAMRGQLRDGGDRSQMREQMQANRAKYEEQFKGVLTPDQYAKFTALEQQRGGGRGPGMGGPGRPAPTDQPVDGKVKVKNDKVKIKATDK